MIDRVEIADGYWRACVELEDVLARAGDAELRSHSVGTRWTNEELLYFTWSSATWWSADYYL